MTPMSTLPEFSGELALLGCGRMGLAMLRGWLEAGLPSNRLHIIEPAPADELAELTLSSGLRWAPAPISLENTAVLVVAVKPQVLQEALKPVATALKGAKPLVISIVAGKPVSAFQEILGPLPVVRAMPNTPAAIGKGITGFVASKEVSEDQRELAAALLRVLGEVWQVTDEADIDKITAISGSGPAYVFLMAECLAEAARKLGLPEDMADDLALHTLAGAAALLEQGEDDAAELRRAVTSPGGTTEAALKILMDEKSGLCQLLEKATKAAEQRARELAKG